MVEYVAYYRVSPGGRRKDKKLLQAMDEDEQRAQVLSLESQRNEVTRYLNAQPGHPEILKEFIEIESGRSHKNRPKLKMAMAECKRRKAVLIIAKLDRLARNVFFISGLMESKVEFVAVDMPAATPLTIHILAAVAEDERNRISKRIKAALTVLKERGVKLGNKDMPGMTRKAQEALREHRGVVSLETKLLIESWREKGWALAKIASALNEKGVKTPMDRKWYASSVRNQIITAPDPPSTS